MSNELWRIHFITSWDDEPSDTVIQVPDESGGLVAAASEEDAKAAFEADPRASYYIDEGSWWPVPEGVNFRELLRSDPGKSQ